MGEEKERGRIQPKKDRCQARKVKGKHIRKQ